MPNNDKDLRSLNRRELLEMLVIQTRRVEELEQSVRELQKKIDDKKIEVNKIGNIAEAAISVNEVFASAQRAADQYLENIDRLVKEKEAALNSAKEKADQIISDAEKEAAIIIDGARAQAEKILSPAKKSKNSKPKNKKKR